MNRKRLSAWIASLVCALVLACPAGAQNNNVTVDDQPTAEQRVGEVKELRQAGRVEQAVDLMQELIEGSRFKLVGLGDGSYADVERWCRSQLLTDPALRNAYRSRFSAAAERELAKANEGDLSIPALQEVYRRYAVTEAGLEAGLLLVGMLLESGEALSAKSLIDELTRHPDRLASRDRIVFLRGAAAAYIRELDVAKDAIDQLDEMGLDKQRDQLAVLTDSIQMTPGVVRSALLDAGNRPQALDQPLWKQSIINSSNAQSWVMRDVFTLPRVTSSLALINNGRQVVAFDRASGQRSWVYPADDDPEVSRGPGGLQRWLDARSVAFDGAMACAILGECYGITDTRNPYVTQNKLVCIDPQTGRAKWQRASGVVLDNEPTLDQDRREGRVNLQYTHFVGTPVIARGRVLALLRRTSTNNAQHNWLLCFDGEDGSLVWYRHLSILALSGGRDISITTPQISVQGETVYITDGIATVGSIDIQSGGYHWLRILPVGFGSTQRLSVKTRGVLSPPVLTRAGLLVSLSLSREPMMLLDPEDGSVLQEFDEHPKLSNARYMLDAKGGAVVVTYDTVCYWHAMDAEVKWTFTLGPDEYTVGRGDVTANYLVMPTNKRIVVIDRETGDLIDQAVLTETSRATNLIARDGELFAIDDAKLSLYATWDSVFKRLVKRVQQSPGDPSGGIALASLALKQEGLEDEVLQGVAYALEAIDHQPAERGAQIRELVFDQLRQLAPMAADPNLRSELFDRMAMVSQTAAQETAYHLDAGLFYAQQGQPHRAVGHLHAVLAEPAFAAQPYAGESHEGPAAAIAEQQIRALIDQHGQSIYARYDAMAQAWLEQVKAPGNPDAATLINIARRFPLSVDTVEILLEAGGLNEKQGKRMEAASLYQQAVLRATDRPMRQQAVGTLLAFYLDNGQLDYATELIEREAYRNARLMPIDPATGSPVRLEDWRQRITDAEPDQAQRQSLGPMLGQPVVLPGRLIGYAPGLKPSPTSSRFYLQQADGAVSCFSAVEPAESAWLATVTRGGEAVELLADDTEQAVFWSPQQGIVTAVDPRTGKTVWRTVLALPGRDGNAEIAQAQEATENQFLVTVSSTVICVGRRQSAELFTIDRATGGVLWRQQLAVSQLTALKANQWSVFAVGPAGALNHSRNGRLFALDLFSGESVRPNMQQIITLTPRDLHLSGQQLIVVGNSGVASLDRWSGRTQWVKRFQGGLTGLNAFAGQLIAVAGADSVVYLLDTQNEGQHVGQILMRNNADDESMLAQADSGQVFLAGGIGLVCMNGKGTRDWQAAALSPPQHPVQLVLGDTHLAMLTKDKEADGFEADSRLSVFDRKGGRLLSQHSLDKLGDEIEPQRATLAGPAILIPRGSETYVVPTKQAE